MTVLDRRAFLTGSALIAGAALTPPAAASASLTAELLALRTNFSSIGTYQTPS